MTSEVTNVAQSVLKQYNDRMQGVPKLSCNRTAIEVHMICSGLTDIHESHRCMSIMDLFGV